MEFLYFLEKLRVPGLNEFMLTITHLGEETAFLVLSLIFFWCVNKYHGYYLLGVGLFGSMANQFLKILCRIPRPWVRDPNFTVVGNAKIEATGYSFPSGHSQTAVGTLGCIAATQKHRMLRGVCIALMILVPLSRLYLGVHTPADVLVGSVMALVLVFAFYPLMLGNGKKNIPWVFAGLLVLNVVYLLFLKWYPFGPDVDGENYLSAVKNGNTFLGCLAGLLVVYVVDEKKLHFTTEAVWWAQIIKVVIGLGLVLLIKEGTRSVLEMILWDVMAARAVRYFLIVVVAGIVWPMTFSWFSSLGRKQ